MDIYGAPEPLLSGRMTAPPQITHRAKHIDVPQAIYDENKKIQLSIDICYINKLVF